MIPAEINALIAAIPIATRPAALPIVTFLTPWTNEKILGIQTHALQAVARPYLPAYIQLLVGTLSPLQLFTSVRCDYLTCLALHHAIMVRVNAADSLRQLSLPAWQLCMCYQAAVALKLLTGHLAVLELEGRSRTRLEAAGTPEPVGEVIVSINCDGEPEITYPPERKPVERIAAGIGCSLATAEEVVNRLLLLP